MRLTLSTSLSWLVLSASLARGESSGSTCAQLASTLPSSIFFPDTQTYNASLSSYPFLQLRLHPTCILRPNSVQDVVTAINILRESNCTKFAVRGGGHNANAGYNNIEDGVTIDMQSLNKVEVARGDQVVRVGAGAIWQNVYDEVEKKNLTVLGGRVGVVGTAGFLTGGGISFFSPEHGWACDAVQNFEVVLANGTLINANATSHTTLFAALKGGQANFGIVTRFDLKTYPASPIWGGRVIFTPNATIPFITAYSNMKLGTYDPYIAGWFTLRYNHSTATVNPVGIFWHTKPALKPGALKPFVALPKEMNGIVEAPVSAHTRNASRAVTSNPQRTIWATTTFRITPTVLHRIYAAWMELVPAVGEQFAYAKVLQEITVQAVPALPKAGGPQNSLGFGATETPEKDLVFLQIMFHFEDGAAMEGLEVALEEFLEAIEDVARSEGVLHRWKYLNFAAAFQDPLASYGWEKKSELRKVARKYDPRGLFQKQVPGGFKVSR